MPKLIDAEIFLEWLEKSEAADKFWTTTVEPVIKFDLITDAINAGTFDPTPVQPDIEIDPHNLPESTTIKLVMTRSEYEKRYGTGGNNR
ncbi:hypothetical protein D3C81_173760 [compost metagenome]